MGYPGGKSGSGVYQKIINQMPPHKTYIEPFLGGGAIMRLKCPAAHSIGIDIDPSALVAFDVDIPGLRLYNCSATDFLISDNLCMHENTLIYLDPPYLLSTRSSQRPIYQFEFMTDDEHSQLLNILCELPCMILISGYWSELYADILREWRVISFQAQTRGGHPATEYLWMNFEESDQLHDYRYLGDNYRERERIKRKIQRWKRRLRKMDALERHAMMAALKEVQSSKKTVQPGDVEQAPPDTGLLQMAGAASQGMAMTAGICNCNDARRQASQQMVLWPAASSM